MNLRNKPLDAMLAQVARLGALADDLAIAGRCAPAGPYPWLFAELVGRHWYHAFDAGEVRVYGNVPGEEDSLDALARDRVLAEALLAGGFSMFGRPTTGSYDRVCFDMRNGTDVLDVPVVVMDHEAILSFSRLPKPRVVAVSFAELLQMAVEQKDWP